MSMIKSEQEEKIEVFLKYIYRNNISITVDRNVENQNKSICEQLSYPTEKYPKGLIALYNGYDLLHFYRVSGKYFGRTLVKRRFEISQK